jgi:hypothetical protein
MAVRKRPRLAMVVVRSPTRQGVRRELQPGDERRVHMELSAGGERRVVVMASPEEVRAVGAARLAAASSDPASPPAATGGAVGTRASVPTETQRRLLVSAQRARHFLLHRSVVDGLDRERRGEMLCEIRRLKEAMRSLEEQIAVTTRNVESMERLAREFRPRGGGSEWGSDGPGLDMEVEGGLRR